MALLKSCAILQSSWVATVTGRKDSDARYADCLLLDQHRVLDREELALKHLLHGGGLLERAADEGVLIVVADLFGVLRVLDEVIRELLLLADGALDRLEPLADLHLPVNATLFFAFE